MKSLLMVAMMVAAAATFAGCKKEKTPGEKLDAAMKSAEKSAEAGAKDAEKAGGDLQKKLDEALKK